MSYFFYNTNTVEYNIYILKSNTVILKTIDNQIYMV